MKNVRIGNTRSVALHKSIVLGISVFQAEFIARSQLAPRLVEAVTYFRKFDYFFEKRHDGYYRGHDYAAQHEKRIISAPGDDAFEAITPHVRPRRTPVLWLGR
jgi:hypothetical protein